MRRIAALAISIPVLMAQSDRSPLHSVTAVRHWSLPDVTRVAVEVTGDFKYRSDRLHNPERVYYDILESRPRVENRRSYAETIDDQFLQRVRVAETIPGITRVVLDLTGVLDIKVSQLSNPSRLIIELRQNTNPPTIPTAAPAPAFKQPVLPGMSTDPVAPPKPPPVVRAEARTETPATLSKPPFPVTTAPIMPKEPQMMRSEAPPAVTAEPSKVQMAAKVPSAKSDVAEKNVAEKIPPPPPVETPKPATNAPAVAELGKAARHTSSGDTSLVRALGLKIGRVVIDPGHGGHDQGTEGPHGLLEKELVLDVAMRVGKLIEDRMGAEVIYTRTDDTFIPLEGRTGLANEKKADLFLSIHANSSPVPRISGVETYYLNFAASKEAADLAARENAASQHSIFDLQDIVQKITLHDKAEESHEFASRLQTALFAFSSKNFPAEKNRGVKKAPFVVLIGATMPSVLAEIGFLSNTREESLLKKPDYRQKLAEALYRGISRYAETLSHFQVAKNQ
jgi:N-acetylmuramoyl-L-alanine amidase